MPSGLYDHLIVLVVSDPLQCVAGDPKEGGDYIFQSLSNATSTHIYSKQGKEKEKRKDET